MSNQDFNPETHIRGDDGQIYEIKRVVAVGVAAGMHVDGVEKSDLNRAIEAAMAEAAATAQGQGVADPDEIRRRLLAARDQVLAGNP